MKKVKVLTFSVLSVMMASCTNDNINDAIINNENSSIETKAIMALTEEEEMQKTAELLTAIDINKDIMAEVKDAVTKSIYYGTGEDYRFTDMLNGQESKFALSRSSQQSSLIQALLNIPQTKETNEDIYTLLKTLSDNDIEINWPYSELWDGKKTPTIIYSRNEGSDIYGYKKNSIGEIDTIIVDDDYAKTNPVWILKKDNISYDELPNFSKGEYVNKYGMMFISEAARKAGMDKGNNIPQVPGSTVYIGTIKSYMYDGGLGNDSPEFQFHWGAIDWLANKAWVSSYYYEMPYSRVKHDVQIDWCLQGNWDKNQLTNRLLILEKDGGKNKVSTHQIKGIEPLTGVLKTFDVSMPYEKNDEVCFDVLLERSVIFSDQNKSADGNWKRHQGYKFELNLPTK